MLGKTLLFLENFFQIPNCLTKFCFVAKKLADTSEGRRLQLWVLVPLTVTDTSLLSLLFCLYLSRPNFLFHL